MKEYKGPAVDVGGTIVQIKLDSQMKVVTERVVPVPHSIDPVEAVVVIFKEFTTGILVRRCFKVITSNLLDWNQWITTL
ncbi:hypothetical protein Tco_0899732 [Tanacetum coccineum]